MASPLPPSAESAAGRWWRDTPWAAPKDWESIREGLFSAATSERRRACATVHVWMLKGLPVPLFLQCTVQLVEALLLALDRKSTLAQRRLCMSMAVVRFVNCVVEGEQRGAVAQSVSSLAAKQGLPKWLVDIRHDATHGTLPSSSVLDIAFETCMEWLHAKYWAPQHVLFAQERKSTGHEQQDELFAQLTLLLNKGDVKPVHGPRPKEDAVTARDVCEHLKPDVWRLANVLCSVSVTVPTEGWAECLGWLNELWGGGLSELLCLRTSEMGSPKELHRWCALLTSRTWLSARGLELSPVVLRDAVRNCLAKPTPMSRSLVLEVLLPALGVSDTVLLRDFGDLMGFATHQGLGLSKAKADVDLDKVVRWCDEASTLDLDDTRADGSQEWAAVDLPPGTPLGGVIVSGTTSDEEALDEQNDLAPESSPNRDESAEPALGSADIWSPSHIAAVAKRVRLLYA